MLGRENGGGGEDEIVPYCILLNNLFISPKFIHFSQGIFIEGREREKKRDNSKEEINEKI